MTHTGPGDRGRSSTPVSSPRILICTASCSVYHQRALKASLSWEECCWITGVSIWLFIPDSILRFLEVFVIKSLNIWISSVYINGLKSVLRSPKLISNSHVIAFFKKKHKMKLHFASITLLPVLGTDFYFLFLITALFLHLVVYLHFFLNFCLFSFY